MIGLVVKNNNEDRGTVMSSPSYDEDAQQLVVVVMWDDYSISSEYVEDLKGVTPEEYMGKEEDKPAAVLQLIPNSGEPDDTTH